MVDKVAAWGAEKGDPMASWSVGGRTTFLNSLLRLMKEEAGTPIADKAEDLHVELTWTARMKHRERLERKATGLGDDKGVL